MNTNQYISERGQALVIIAFALIVVIGMTGLAVDGGNIYADRRSAQNAADAAVLASSISLVRGNSWLDAEASGKARASSNGYDDEDASTTVELNNPPISGEYAGNSEYIQAIIVSNVDTFFAPIVGIDQLTNQVEAVSRVVPVSVGPTFEGLALVGLSPFDCSAIKFQGSANATITGGGLYINSNCEDEAFFNESAGAILTAPSLCAVGGIKYKEGALDIPLIEEGCDPVGYPPEDLIMPEIDCPVPATRPDDGPALTPGNYTKADFGQQQGKFPPDGVTFLNSGVYCVEEGDFILNGGDSLTGVDVTIYIIKGKITWSGNAEIHLDAPETGKYLGLLIVMPLDNLSPVIINGTSDSTWEGTILVPGSNVTISGTGGSEGSFSSQVIGYTIFLTGASEINIDYSADKSYSGGIPPKLEFVE